VTPAGPPRESFNRWKSVNCQPVLTVSNELSAPFAAISLTVVRSIDREGIDRTGFLA
jgi:hypothetical protein